ncbi:MAG TPA: peptidylprolyl isomerase [Steroidobacteraceae bacterium]|jgi:peptidylprolyl isomerase
MNKPWKPRSFALAVVLSCPAWMALAAPPPKPAEAARRPPTAAEVIAASSASDWRALDAKHTLYMELPTGRVIIELAPQFAPHHVANIEALAREGYYDGLAIVRAQDNYVVQWADPEGKRPVRNAQKTLSAEFERPSRGVPFNPLPDPDTYAPEVGFSDGFPAALDPKFGRAWLVHCYGMVGAGRDNDVDSGGGTELYAVIGQAPRHLDRNVTLVGRVVQGMELLSSLSRGTGPLGFYEKPEQRVPIKSIRLASEVPPAERTELEVMRTDTPIFAAYVESRRNRREEWFKVPAGRVDVCNIPVPVRSRAGSPKS